MSDKDDRTASYASAELGDIARGDASTGKSADKMLHDHAASVPTEDVDFISYLDGLLLEDDRIDGGLKDTPLGDLVLKGRATKAATEAAENGNISQMKALTGLTSNDTDAGGLLSNFSRQLADEGAIGLVYGPPGAGKTAALLDAGRIWKAITGGKIVSNVEWDGADKHATSTDEILNYMGSVSGPVLALLDEVREQLKADNRTLAEAFAEDLRLIRKEQDDDDYPKKGSVALVAHTELGTAPVIRRLASLGLRKPDRSNPPHAELLNSVGGVDEWETVDETHDLTDSAEDFETHESSEFTVVLEDDGDSADGELSDVDREKRMAVIRVLQGQSQEDASVGLSFSRGWVGDRWREWRDGDREMRSLLPLDDPDLPLPADPTEDDLPTGTTVDEIHGLG